MHRPPHPQKRGKLANSMAALARCERAMQAFSRKTAVDSSWVASWPVCMRAQCNPSVGFQARGVVDVDGALHYYARGPLTLGKLANMTAGVPQPTRSQ